MNGRAVLAVEGATRRFGSLTAVDGVSLALGEGAFAALLGPSGCGKSTLLRMIAGFERPDAGRILIDGRDVTPEPPQRRAVNLMFQSYALFPHMTVARNVAYGLEMERLPRREIAARVEEALGVVQLSEQAGKRPDRLSGGQRQRVALARALVKRPRALLLDEPLAALDRRLREAMQFELKRLQHEVGIAFLVVTHDQEEALSLADRVTVLNAGRVEQTGTPEELYERPATRFVAEFLGDMNLIDGQAAEGGLAAPGLGVLPATGRTAGGAATLALRPERLRLGAPGAGHLDATVTEVIYRGADRIAHLEAEGLARPLVARVAAGDPVAAGLAPGARLSCGWEAAHATLLPD